MDASSSAIAQTSWWSRVPTFLKLWAGLQIGGTAILGVIDPVHPGWSWTRAAAGLLIPFLLFVTMLRHSKGAWVITVLLEFLALISSPGYWDDSPAYVISVLMIVLLNLGILLSPQARDWVNQPTERKWTYTPRKERGRLRVWRCTNCGDTFPSSDLHPTCPSCSGNDLEPASEPML